MISHSFFHITVWYHIWHHSMTSQVHMRHHMWHHMCDFICDITCDITYEITPVMSHVISHIHYVMSYCDVICDITQWYEKMNVISHMMCLLVVYAITYDIITFFLWYHIIVISHCDITYDITCDKALHHLIYATISYMMSHMISYSDCDII